MPTLHLARRLVLAGSALVLLSAAAEAQVRYIAFTGKDTNNCASPATPCRTLSRGIATTPVGGELRVLDSSVYGKGGLINKSMTISAHGETVMLDGEIKIDAAGAVVTLRGLSVNGHSVATTGVNIISAAAVHIDNCVFERFRGIGIWAQPGNAFKLFINDSVSRDNAIGLAVFGLATALTVENSRFEGNRELGLASNSGGTFTRTVAAGNQKGFYLHGGGNVVSSIASDNDLDGYDVGKDVHFESSVARGNGQAGLAVFGLVSISNFVATNNGVGIRNHGTVLTRKNNTVTRNTTDIIGSQPVALTPL